MSAKFFCAVTIVGTLLSTATANAATFLFIRHAESTTNSGSASTPEEVVNPPLTNLGTQQAIDLLDVLTGVDLTTIYVSSYQRTSLTIQPTADYFGLTPIVEPLIREWSFGTSLTALSKVPALFGQWFQGNTAARLDGVPESESLDELVARVVPAYEAIFQAYKDQDGVVAIVGHGGSIGWTMPFFAENVSLTFGLSNTPRNTGIITVEAGADGRPYVSDWDGIAFEVPGGVPAPVPLPAPAFALLAALGALGLVRARRSV